MTAKIDLSSTVNAYILDSIEDGVLNAAKALTQAQATQEVFIKAMLAAGVPYIDESLTVGGVVTSVTGFGLYEVKIKVSANDLAATKALAPKMLKVLQSVFPDRGYAVVAVPTLSLFRRSLLQTQFLVSRSEAQ